MTGCDILLAVIGPHWAGDREQGQTRIMQENDWVRIEIDTALKKNIPIVPVLIDRTPMPRADSLPVELRDLVYRQAATVDTQIDFNSHIERLIREIDRLLGLESTASASPTASGIFANVSSWPRRGLMTAYLVAALCVCALAVSLGYIFWNQKKSVDPAYAVYSSPELGVTVIYPNNIFTLDNTERKQRKLAFKDGDGQTLIRVLRTPIPEVRDPKLGRQNEITELMSMNFVLTYIAPEKDDNWTNWYVLSGLNHGTEFYFRRWYSDDSVVSMEFTYPKELAPLFDKLIPTMRHELVFTSAAPKIAP